MLFRSLKGRPSTLSRERRKIMKIPTILDCSSLDETGTKSLAKSVMEEFNLHYHSPSGDEGEAEYQDTATYLDILKNIVTPETDKTMSWSMGVLDALKTPQLLQDSWALVSRVADDFGRYDAVVLPHSINSLALTFAIGIVYGKQEAKNNYLWRRTKIVIPYYGPNATVIDCQWF